MKPKSNAHPILEIDFKIRFRKKVYQLNLKRLWKWLIPLILVGVKMVANLRRDGP